MPNQTLQLFNPLAIHGLAIHLKDFDYRRFTLPYYLSSEDKQRLIALLLGALRAQAPAEGKDTNEPIGSLIQLRWEDRAWRNAAQAPRHQVQPRRCALAGCGKACFRSRTAGI